MCDSHARGCVDILLLVPQQWGRCKLPPHPLKRRSIWKAWLVSIQIVPLICRLERAGGRGTIHLSIVQLLSDHRLLIPSGAFRDASWSWFMWCISRTQKVITGCSEVLAMPSCGGLLPHGFLESQSKEGLISSPPKISSCSGWIDSIVSVQNACAYPFTWCLV